MPEGSAINAVSCTKPRDTIANTIRGRVKAYAGTGLLRASGLYHVPRGISVVPDRPKHVPPHSGGGMANEEGHRGGENA